LSQKPGACDFSSSSLINFNFSSMSKIPPQCLNAALQIF
jgi:hypothetical protein